ncbi:TonB-dependent receptor plug domain-containing protein [Frigidibacter mobilis]|uniref:Putative TonB-denpendent receptor n=1 Tax=Frigidibacter mobilis TaxID=1335048 RepID=A0A159Z6L0_9RHOB|nr:TonB-dependent receptor [Frigidibacter mobilis]AMY70995.1 putative TonB-denpendent receptor [Frigidibacter mobilis]
MRKVLLTPAFCLTATVSLAQDPGYRAGDVIELDAIIVDGSITANCVPQDAAREDGDTRPVCLGRGVGRGDLPGATLDHSQFDRLPTGARANTLVKRLPSVTTGGGPGEDKDARVLGLDKEYTRTLVDGLQLPDGGEKREFNLDRYPVAMVDSVEVVRAKTADMEADGIAGKILLHTKDIPDELTRRVEATMGRGSDGLNTYGLTGHVGGMITPDFGAQAVINIARDGGSKEKVKDAANGTRETESESKPITSREILGDVMVGTEVGTFRFKPTVLWQEEAKDKTKAKFTAAGASNGREVEDEDKVKQTVGASLSWVETFGVLELEARGSVFRGSEDKDKTKSTYRANGALQSSETESEHKVDENRSFEMDAKAPILVGPLDGKVKMGLAYRDKHRTKDKDKNGVLATGKDRYILDEEYAAGFVMGDLAFGDVTLKPGLRYEYNRLDGRDPTTGAQAGGTSHDLLPSVAASWQVNEAWSLSGGIGRSVNRPKFDQLSPFETTSGSTIKIGNPDLDPQRATTYDLDLTRKGKRVELVFGLWHRDITGVIEDVEIGTDASGKTIESPQNVGDGTTTGLSMTQRFGFDHLQSPLWAGLTIGSNQNWARSRLHVAASGETRSFKEQPDFWGDIFVEWHSPSDKLSLMAAAGYAGRITTAGDNGNEVRDSELTLDLKATYTFDNDIQVYVMGENLLETERVKRKANGDVERESGPSLVSIGLIKQF